MRTRRLAGAAVLLVLVSVVALAARSRRAVAPATSTSAKTPTSIPDEREASRILQGMREKMEQDANLDQVFTEESLAALATLRRLAAEKVSLGSPVDRLASTPVPEFRPSGDTNAEQVRAVTRLDVDLVQVELVDEKLCLRRERGRWLVDLTETAARFSGTGRYR